MFTVGLKLKINVHVAELSFAVRANLAMCALLRGSMKSLIYPFTILALLAFSALHNEYDVGSGECLNFYKSDTNTPVTP